MGMRLSLVEIHPDEFAGLAQDPESLARLLLGPADRTRLDLDKQWHAIHFLLTGDAWTTEGEFASVIFGGSEFGPDLSYGAARLLTPEQVRENAAKLQTPPVEDLRARYDPVAMSAAQIYPDVWKREGNAALERLLEAFFKLRDFYAQAGARGNSVILAVL